MGAVLVVSVMGPACHATREYGREIDTPSPTHPVPVEAAPTADQLDAWLAQHWSPQRTLRDWWSALAAHRLAFPGWSPDHGGLGWGRADLRRRDAAFGDAGAIGPPTGLGVLMGAPVVATYGTPEQQQRWLPALAAGTEGWCQLFSEPGAGSDLAGLRTRATLDGEEWIIDGQKVWTSGAAVSARGMLVARTNADVPKHRGLTYFIVEMDQPGVEVRPLRQMNDQAHFSEVFFDGARVAVTDVVGEVDHGWELTVATLGHERAGLGSAGVPGVRPPAGEQAGMLDLTCAEVIERLGSVRAEAADAPGAADRLTELADGADHLMRQRLVDLHARERMADWGAVRARADGRAGRSSAAASTAKMAWTERLKVARDVSLEIQGPGGMLVGEDAPDGGAGALFALSVPSASIAGGTDEIQRNILGERVLGLPKDIATDRDIPFRDVPQRGGG